MESQQIEAHRMGYEALRADYALLECAEDKLSWLMERCPLHGEVDPLLCTPERRVAGCLSGLWLDSEIVSDRLLFRAKSESSLVQGVVSFLCDLYSGRSAEEILRMGRSMSDELQLERLLTLTRRRAIESTVSYFLLRATLAIEISKS
jgi:cysteine desulfuration protein SufE